MNRTLIEAARTMLADSLLPTTFWAEAVSTACYIFNRVRVTKPQNKTPYELLFGHKPIISYIRPFGCHVTILDTLSVLGKFDGKSDEGFLVGYSLNSKAYRVYNLVTKRVEVNLHVNFLEDKPNVKGVGYRWMFDIDYLTDSMNYIPVSLENQANPHAGTSEATNNAGTSQTPNSNASEEKDEDIELIVVPSAVKITEEKVESRTSSTNLKKEEILTEPQQEKKLEEIALKHLGTVPENNSTSTPSVNTGNQTVNTSRLDPDDSPMPELEIFHNPTPTLRIHNIHPKSQILGDSKSAVQTRSREEPKKIAEALQDDSWVQAMQEELLQFKLQQVWVLVDLPYRMKVIGTNQAKDRWNFYFSQDKYVADMLKKFDLASVKTAITPMETKMALTKDEEADEVDVHLYRSMIGSLMYLTASRPINVRQYVLSSLFRESSFDLEAFSDMISARANLDRRDNPHWLLSILGRQINSRQCKKQP
ncbi:putative ribonuclease H-like domain-containing protein [Tanacetum coccineum]